MRILLSWILCGFLVMWAPVTAQISQQPFTLSISVEEDPAVQSSLENYTVKAGSEVFITVHLTNISKHNLALDIDADSRTGICFAHQYEVRDINGKFATKRTINHPELGSTGHGWPARIVKPGASIDIGDRINGLYDLRQPGQYTIRLSRAIGDDPKAGLVKSNTITVIVTK